MISVPPLPNSISTTLHFEPHILKFKRNLPPRHTTCLHKKRTVIRNHTRKRPLSHIQEVILLVSGHQNSINSRHRKVLGVMKPCILIPIRSRSTKKFLSIKSENLSMVGLKVVQLRRFARYMMILKSPKTQQAELHLTFTLSSSVHKASLSPAAAGPYKLVQIQTDPSTTPFNTIETEKQPTT